MFTDLAPVALPQSTRQAPPSRTAKAGRQHRTIDPRIAIDVLAEVATGVLGMVEDTDTVVVLEDDNRVRLALDDDVVLHLRKTRCVKLAETRTRTWPTLGRKRVPVLALVLTQVGETWLRRQGSLGPI